MGKCRNAMIAAIRLLQSLLSPWNTLDCSILYDNYEIPVKHDVVRLPTPQNNVELAGVLADSCVKAI